MKTKHSVFALVAIASLAFASCGGSGTSSSGVAKKSLFGDIPAYYEEKSIGLTKLLDEVKDVKDEGKLMSVLEKAGKTIEEMDSEMKAMGEKLVGNAVAYTMSDSLPYKFVSDIKVEEVRVPNYALIGRSDVATLLYVTFNIVLTEQVDHSERMLYFIMDDDTPIGYGMTKEMGYHEVGDTLHIREGIESPAIPAKYVKGCNALKFVTEAEYRAGRETMSGQHEAWNKEFKKGNDK